MGLMKLVYCFLMIFALGALNQRGALAQEPKVPRPAGDIGIQTGPGQYIWLSQYEGKTCILAFILTTCPHCQFTTGILNRIQKDYADRGVQVIESAVEPMSSLHIPDFVKKMGTIFPVGYNEESYVAKFLGLPPTAPMLFPSIVMVDAKGVLRVQYDPDDARLRNDTQEKTLREDLDKTIKEGQAPSKAPAHR
jgi:thiol-disulfide isomerase/thioredoxin